MRILALFSCGRRAIGSIHLRAHCVRSTLWSSQTRFDRGGVHIDNESAEVAIQTHGLAKRYGPKTAVEDLTLTVRRGEVFGFLGPNGAGKTTSVKMLLGLVKPTAGTARVLGEHVDDRAVRSRIGFLPEHFRFHDWLTGREFLRLHGRLYGMRGVALEARIDLLLDRVDLSDAADRRMHGYSKGMQQRAGLAQALLNEPDLVFLDEPTSGLDPIGRRLVRDCIAELRDSDTTVFLNSHLLSEVEVTCDRVAFVKNGTVIREMALSADDLAIEVELRVDALTPELISQLRDVATSLVLNGPTVRLVVDSDDRLPQIARVVVGAGARLYHLASVRPSLESVFLDIIGEHERAG